MKIDPKYFNAFLVIAALMAALLIAFFTVSNYSGRQADLRERITGVDSLQYDFLPVFRGGDSLQVASLADSSTYVLLDFWAPWSRNVEDLHRSLVRLKRAHPGRVKIVSAITRDGENAAGSYIRAHTYPFQYVQGDQFFDRYRLPGLPLRLLFDPSGSIQTVFFGPMDSLQYDSLVSAIRH